MKNEKNPNPKQSLKVRGYPWCQSINFVATRNEVHLSLIAKNDCNGLSQRQIQGQG
jgi:hypothetical protein